MGYSFKSIRTVVKMFECRSRPKLSEDAYQKYCVKITRIEEVMSIKSKEPFLPVPPLRWLAWLI